MKIVVRGPNWLGDAIFAQPFYRGLRAAYPDAHLTLLSHSRALGVGEGEWFEEIRTLENGITRKDCFDLGVTLPASISSAFLFWRVGIPHRVGFAELTAELFLTSSLRWKGRRSGVHKSDLYLALLEFLTGKTGWIKFAPPAPSSVVREKRIVIGPGASLPLREWPYFLELCDAIPQRFPGYKYEIVGAPTDAKWRLILRRARHANLWHDRIGETSLAELKQLCASAAVVVANDTGLAHVSATLCRTPTVVLFGPGDPNYVSPSGPVAIVRDPDLPCSPCESAKCRAPFGYQRCLRNINPSSVVEAIARALSL